MEEGHVGADAAMRQELRECKREREFVLHVELDVHATQEDDRVDDERECVEDGGQADC